MRRRKPAVPTRDDAPPELVACRVEDWTTGTPDDLECDREGRCVLTGAEHDRWCRMFTARRRWYAARAIHPTSTPLPHGAPT